MKLSSKGFFTEIWNPVYVEIGQNKLVYHASNQQIKGFLDFEKLSARLEILSPIQFKIKFDSSDKTFTFALRRKDDMPHWIRVLDQ